MEIEFDPTKDTINVEKHGLSLLRVLEMEDIVVVEDHRFSESRFRLYGTLDGQPHCAAATLRSGVIRVINLRRAHEKEYRRHAR